ncbi:MAG: short-chain dehydrogenase, partial [Flavobacteriales bacterium]
QTEMLAEAFPDYKAPLSAAEMATYIFDFSTTGNKFYNGKVLEVSSSTP